ncbi:phage late control D family protein [Paraburkholderia sp.]|uniref:phage late control D family protein n=1 Tax=Paraburkholderia sp. TaxID=1926495 RepID=UPI0025F56D26|nr:contractile injection system protein, VgrG/Pvc8 family [Paraburkholderia sp.]
MDAINDLAPVAAAAVPMPIFVLMYEQKDITNDVTPYVISVSYTDYLDGQSDELNVELEDTDDRWRNAWYPGKGDTLSLKIGYEAEPLLPCGSFEIDEIEFADPPSTVTIRGLATGVKKSVRTRQPHAYEQTTLAAIAERIARRNHLTLVGTIRDIRLDRVTQFQERDVAFLARLAREYGYVFKITGTKLVFTEHAALREADPVIRLGPSDLTSIRLRDKIKDIYAQAKGAYHDPKTKKAVSNKLVANDDKDGKVAGTSTKPADKPRSGQEASGDTLRLSARSGSKAALETRTQAALDRANLQQTSGSLTTAGNTRLVAGNTFAFAEYGRLSGTYLIESARHQLNRGGGYTTEIEIKRASQAVKSHKGGAAKKSKNEAPAVYGDIGGKVDAAGTTSVKRNPINNP